MWRRRQSKVESVERLVVDRIRARERTMDRAAMLLAAKARSVGELRERLLEKRWTDEAIVAEVIEKLGEYRYLDDDRFARDLAVSRLRQRPQGRRSLERTLSQKKLDKEVVQTALEKAFEEMPENELIRTAVEKRLRLKGRPRTRAELKKFYDYLARRGFGFDAIRDAMSGVGFETTDEDPAA
jgi:regulatory protein